MLGMDKDGQFYQYCPLHLSILSFSLLIHTFLELNVERRRKRKAIRKLNGIDDDSASAIDDPLIVLLMDKENR